MKTKLTLVAFVATLVSPLAQETETLRPGSAS